MLTSSRKTKNVKSEVDAVVSLLQNAKAVVLGVGAGFSASAGLDYNDPDFFEQDYSEFTQKGYKNINEAIAGNWYLNESSAREYWGFWSSHINNIYYKHNQLRSYVDLFHLIKDKNYFIITTNADGQFYKGLYDTSRIFAMQGTYGKLQCQKKCHESVYDNKKMIKTMLEHMDWSHLKVADFTVPRCPKCGGLLVPNLRIDGNFVEAPHMVNQSKYLEFLNTNSKEELVFIEFGVGFNTPVIIRSPFEQMTKMLDKASLIRVNLFHPDIKGVESEKAHSICMDASELIEHLLKSET